MSLKIRHLAVLLCLLPVSLWAQNVKLPHILGTNTSGTTSIVAFKGYLAQPILGGGRLTGSENFMATGYIRTIRQFSYSPPINSEDPTAIPFQFGLGQNFPNPFNPSTVIPFTLDHSANASLAIYNLLGQQVRTFDLSDLSAGEYQLTWDGKTQDGSTLPSGEYFARLSHDARMQVRKLTLLK